LPVVPACTVCNAGFSSDEVYFACLISCILAGSTTPEKIARPKIRRILLGNPSLQARIDSQRLETNERVIFNPEFQRVATVVTKLAQGHALYELHDPRPVPPDEIYFAPISTMTAAEQDAFESPLASQIWPEVGSRALQRLVITEPQPQTPWIIVQDGLYRYHATADFSVTIRIAIQEYLACYVHWD
jgi:hypothetical protein